MIKNRNFHHTLTGFFMFFLTFIISSTCSIAVYYFASKNSSGNILVVAIAVIGITVICATLCTAIDYVRRKYMVQKPVDQILYATARIASGDFNVKLEHTKEYIKYDEYDIIFDNINTMASELSKNELLKNDFISNVSHEIKTPLAVIQNYAKALQMEKLDKNKQQEYLNGLILQTKKLSDLISNILKLSKLENQQIVPEIEEFDLAELVRVSALSFEHLIEKKNLELVCDIDECKITSSASLIEIALNNLISNAIKFTDPQGKITVSLKHENNSTIISVADTGCGISKDIGTKIFDKFYQGDTSHASEGNGLGLALVKKVIDLLGGAMSVESKVGVGSTFTLTLKKG